MLLRALQRTRISCSCACLMRPPKRWWLLLAIILARLLTHPQHLERLMIGPMAFLNLVKAIKTILKRNNISQILAVMIACIAPLVKAGIAPADYPFTITSLTGYSGGGKKMIGQYESEPKDYFLYAPRQYGLSQQHKHLPEVTHVCGLTEAPIFMPIVDDYYSGMEVSVGLHTRLLAKPVTVEDVHAALVDFYKDSTIVKVAPLNLEEDNKQLLNANKLSNTDGMVISVTGNNDRMVVHAIFDNLGKGASGAAVQCMNIALGLPEETGLSL